MVDTARESVSQSFNNMKESLKQANPSWHEKLEQTSATITKTTSEFEQLGFCTNYKNFNVELFRPFKRADKDKPLIEEIKSTLTLKPEDLKLAFVVWNVLCFWLGVVDFIVLFLVATDVVAGALTIAAMDGFAGYCVAYFVYFIFVCSVKKKWMLLGVIFLVSYVCWLIYHAYNSVTSIDVIEVLIDVPKIAFNSILTYHAFMLYKETKEEESAPKESAPKDML